MAMTKRRFVTPEEITDEDLGEMPREVRFTALVLRMWADDEGRARLNVRSLKGAAFANDLGTSEDDLTMDVLKLEECGYLRTYVVGDRQYYQVLPRFHTPPEKPKPSELPPPPPPGASGQHPDAIPVEGREGESRERASEGPAGQHPDSLPPMFCTDHMPIGSGGVPCGPCRDARMVHEAELRRRRAGASDDESA